MWDIFSLSVNAFRSVISILSRT